MLLEIKCSSCGSTDVVYEQEQDIFFCKNPECDDFDCVWEWTDMTKRFESESFYIKDGMTKEITYQAEYNEGEWYTFKEKIEKGKIIECEKVL